MKNKKYKWVGWKIFANAIKQIKLMDCFVVLILFIVILLCCVSFNTFSK